MHQIKPKSKEIIHLQIIPALIILPPEEVFMMETLIFLALIKLPSPLRRGFHTRVDLPRPKIPSPSGDGGGLACLPAGRVGWTMRPLSPPPDLPLKGEGGSGS